MLDEECIHPDEGKRVVQNGEYLCVQYWEHPLHVYKLVQPGRALHPNTPRTEHEGKVYGLVWIEDDKEHGTYLSSGGL